MYNPNLTGKELQHNVRGSFLCVPLLSRVSRGVPLDDRNESAFPEFLFATQSIAREDWTDYQEAGHVFSAVAITSRGKYQEVYNTLVDYTQWRPCSEAFIIGNRNEFLSVVPITSLLITGDAKLLPHSYAEVLDLQRARDVEDEEKLRNNWLAQNIREKFLFIQPHHAHELLARHKRYVMAAAYSIVVDDPDVMPRLNSQIGAVDLAGIIKSIK